MATAGIFLLGGDLYQPVDIAGAIEERVVGVAVQMDKGHGCALPGGGGST
jgi:hypothetical protein